MVSSLHSRIIFFISIGDILQSLGIIIGPHAIPREYTDLGAYWAKGTTTSCNIAGIITATGSIYMVPFFTLVLSYYFLKRVKDKVKPAEFAKSYEIKIHAFLWSHVIAACLYAYFRHLFNAADEGQLCIFHYTREQLDCLQNETSDDGVCSARKRVQKEIGALAIMPLITMFCLMASNLVRLIMYVYKEEKLMHLEALDQEQRRRNIQNSQEITTTGEEKVHPKEQGSNQPEEANIDEETSGKKSCCWVKCGKKENKKAKRSLTRKALIQSSMYIISFLVAYSLPIAVTGISEAKGKVPMWLRWLQNIIIL
ncbi:predicted protein [Chaetoceros tenuissimus]|uniref:Uncharacterized protein n=1 Tax=Chaetoceros tenuissimus TaxID=426638 RepID=A0AAD3CW94_9STRA|nr:predicted protein [Chaetoceros tenuissimus]